MSSLGEDGYFSVPLNDGSQFPVHLPLMGTENWEQGTGNGMYGWRGKIGLLVPANNSVIEPEMWRVLPEKVSLHSRRTWRHCITAATALWAALEALGRRAVSIATPYPRALHARVAPFFRDLGFTVVSEATADILDMAEVPRRPPQEAYSLARSICRPETEVLVILATDFRTFEILDALEQDTGRPAISTNQALLWHALRTLGVHDRLPGLGTLLREH